MKFHIYVDAEGGYRWRLRAANGLIMADSGESYEDEDNTLDAIRLLQREVRNAEVVKDG